MAVLIAVGPADGELLIFKQNESRDHVIREKSDIYFGRDELHGHIIADLVDGNGRVLANLACDTVIETVLQPMRRLRFTGMIL